MNNSFFAWLRQQSRRDQIALMLCAVCVSLALLWMLLIQPINNATADSKQRLQNSVEILARVKSLASSLQYYEGMLRTQPGSQPISAVRIIDQSSRASELSFSSVNPSANGEEVTVRFDNVDFVAMLQWLYDLENTHQAKILDLRLNNTNQAGYVSGSTRIKK